MNRPSFFSTKPVIAVVSLIAPAAGAELCMSTDAGQTQLSLCGVAPYHSTPAAVGDARLIEVPNSTVVLVLWNETPPGGTATPYYAVAFDGQNVSTVETTPYELRLRYARFDPAVQSPPVDGALAEPADNRMYIVQFVTPPLSVFRDQVRASGGTIRHPLQHNAHVVEMDPTVKALVAALPYVRAVVPHQPAYRLEPHLVANLADLQTLLPQQRYNVMVFERGLAQKTAVADQIVALGGTVNRLTPGGFLLEATLTPSQLPAVAASNDVAFIDRWGESSTDMDVAREVSGANYTELTRLPPFLGQGVIGEVMDYYLDVLHQAFQTNPPVVHGAMGSLHYHGTGIFGIVFGDGTGAPIEHPELPPAKGMAPDAQGVFADQTTMTDRYCHTCELVSSDCAEVCQAPDPAAPYQAVFQTNSWGGPLTLDYSNVSWELDDIIFTYDLLLCQSQSNCGACSDSRLSRPEAWSKNVVSVGGVYHLNNKQSADDSWSGIGSNWCQPLGSCELASTGPASDGRIKPDLTNFYDLILTTAPAPASPYTLSGAGFGGTSAATPITCGDFGLFFQMWHEGLFPVSQFWAGPVAPSGGQASVFESRPHASTAKALLINTAMQYDFNVPQTNPHHTLTRDKQGWGMPSAGKLLALARRDAILLVVNESDVLTEYARLVRFVDVPPGAAALKITLVYTDPAGTPASDWAMANHLYLYAVGNIPVGPSYFGNLGLRSDIWSPPRDGLSPEPWIQDTVQNIFVKDPVPGGWQIAVGTGPVYVDARPETPDIDDVDYALVVSVDFDCDAGPDSRLDSEEIADGSRPDCNRNGVPDSCDITTGASSDSNGNGVPDECEPPPPNVIWNPDPLSPIRASRTLTMSLAAATATGGSGTAAIQVRLIDLQNPNPANPPCCPPQNFSAYESATCTALNEGNGCARWVGPAVTIREAQDNIALGTFTAARLECTPYYTDWTTLGSIKIVGAEIMPSSTYEMTAYASSCKGLEGSCTNVSAPVQALTRRSGDVAMPYAPTGTQPDPSDVVAVLNKFKNQPGAPGKAIAQIQPNVIELNVDVGALDIVATIDAFKGTAYPFSGPCPCPSLVTCNATACGPPACAGGGLCVKTCNGGTNAGQPCLNDNHCPGSTCPSTGFCRDRCGRCRD